MVSTDHHQRPCSGGTSLYRPPPSTMQWGHITVPTTTIDHVVGAHHCTDHHHRPCSGGTPLYRPPPSTMQWGHITVPTTTIDHAVGAHHCTDHHHRPCSGGTPLYMYTHVPCQHSYEKRLVWVSGRLDHVTLSGWTS